MDGRVAGRRVAAVLAPAHHVAQVVAHLVVERRRAGRDRRVRRQHVALVAAELGTERGVCG